MNTLTSAQRDMLQYTHELSNDILQSIEITKQHPIELRREEIQNVIICGMGGSGIGGMLAKDILNDSLNFPIEFCKSYHLPNYANEHSLVICSSYSGNTEETLHLFNQAIAKKAQVIAICSGGELANRGTTHQVQTIRIPGGKQPRAAVGFSLVQQLHILATLTGNDAAYNQLFDNLEKLCHVLKANAPLYQDQAHAKAKDLLGKQIYTLSTDKFGALVTRFAQQINENAKQRMMTGIIPEMNHNQLVAFADYNENDAVVVINPHRFHPQNAKRTDFLKQRLKTQNSEVIDIKVDGDNLLEVTIKTLYLTDLVSVELAKLRNVDPLEVEVIVALKGEI